MVARIIAAAGRYDVNVGKFPHRCRYCAIIARMARGDGSYVDLSSAEDARGRSLSAAEVFVSGAVAPTTLDRALKDGRVRRLARGVYTTNATDSLEAVTARNIRKIIGLLFPGAVLGDRSAYIGGEMSADGSFYVVSPDVGLRERVFELPGATLRVRQGPGGLADVDLPFPADNIFLSGTARALLENARQSRGRGERLPRTISRVELERWIERLLDQRDEQGLRQLRDQARQIAPELGMQTEFKTIDSLIGAVLGTRSVDAKSPLLRARLQGLPYDEDRVALFKSLREELANRPAHSYPAPADDARAEFLPFFDAYFSNYIEGTEFTVEEAREIIFDRIVPSARPQDAHDILGTYALVSDLNEMRRVPGSFDEFRRLLKSRHLRMLERRPEVLPGEFKTRANRVGLREFVRPERVEGTLAQGFALYETLDEPFARAVYQAFLVAEVHPFADGNGRIARIMMNAELIAAGQERIIIPTVYRHEYINSLKALTNNKNTAALPRVLEEAQRYVASLDFSDYGRVLAKLEETNALREESDDDTEPVKLMLPARLV